MSAHEAQVEPLSLHDEAAEEARRHKWIESQKTGRDLGDHALRDWYRRHWLCYCRFRRLEHLRGTRCWREFAQREFGHLYSLIITGDLLVERILDRVYDGYENLEILTWAIDWGLPLDRVVNILTQIDVNQARMDPRI